MKFKNIICCLALSACLTSYVGATPRNNNSILSVKESITDNDIVYPESFETNTHEMMENWYLQNYAILDADVENKPVGEVSDAEYIKRLRALPTVIEMPYNSVVRSYIDRYIKRNRTLVEEMLGMSLYYMPIFEQALEKEGLPLELKYLPVIESALNPNAVSRAGAAGLWQFMVGTGKGLGLEVNTLVDERRDPYRSSEKAAKYLKNLYQIYNDWSLAIAAYNCGPGNVNKALQRNGNENADFWEIYNYLPRETRGYVPAFIAANYVMTYFKLHNISPGLARKPLITDTVSVNRRVHFSQIARVLNIPESEIRALNPQFRHDVIPGDNHPYMLILPSQQIYGYLLSEDSIAGYRKDVFANRDVVKPGGQTQTLEEYTGQTAYNPPATSAGYQSADNDEGDDEYDEQETQEEQAQIEEVKQIQQQASRSPYKGSYRVDLDEYDSKQAAAQPSRATTVDTDSRASSRHSVASSSSSSSRSSRYASRKSSSSKRTASTESGKSSKRSGKKSAKKQVESKPTQHEVKKGESLEKIAKKTGVSVAELKKANNIKGDGNKIKAGEKIIVPAKGSTAKSSSKSSKASKSSKKSSKKSATSTKSSKKSSSKSTSKKSKRRK